jgi:mono/diheme cytochrome c family protein
MSARGAIFLALLLSSASAIAADASRGEYLVHAGGCIACHIGASGDPKDLSGGHALESTFGTFYAPNITPDRETGIGAWSLEDFARALREGRSPAGDAYYPAFPYTAYSGMTATDIADLKAYLDTLPPVRQANRPHELSWYLNRVTMWVWQLLFFSPQTHDPAAYADPTLARGAYLVRHLGHCGECHTPRNWLGVPDPERDLAGTAEGPDGDPVPNITPDPKQGIGEWSEEEITMFMLDGMLPDGDYAGGAMSDVIDHNTAHLTEDDRRAIAKYLKSLPPIPRQPDD